MTAQILTPTRLPWLTYGRPLRAAAHHYTLGRRGFCSFSKDFIHSCRYYNVEIYTMNRKIILFSTILLSFSVLFFSCGLKINVDEELSLVTRPDVKEHAIKGFTISTKLYTDNTQYINVFRRTAIIICNIQFCTCTCYFATRIFF